MLIPLGNRVVILPAKTEEKKGSIYIPDVAKDGTRNGKVLAVGAGRVTNDGKLIPMTVKLNDRVWFGNYAGSEYQSEEGRVIILSEDDILLREEEKEIPICPAIMES